MTKTADPAVAAAAPEAEALTEADVALGHAVGDAAQSTLARAALDASQIAPSNSVAVTMAIVETAFAIALGLALERDNASDAKAEQIFGEIAERLPRAVGDIRAAAAARKLARTHATVN